MLGIWTAVLLILAPGFARLRLRLDGRALVPAGAPEVAADLAIAQEFGVEDPLAAVVETRDPAGIFNPSTLAHIVALNRALSSIPGVRSEEVVSLATEPGDHVRPGSLDFPPWLDALPSSPAEMDVLRRGLERASIYRGTLLSTDSPPSATAILVGIAAHTDRTELCRRVRLAVANSDVEGDRVLVVGAPVAETDLGENLLRDMVLLVPLAFAVMGAILFAFFRRLDLVLLALAGVGACIFAVLGLVGWCGAPVYLTCLVLPVFLTAVGVAESIHVCDRWMFHLQRSPVSGSKAALEAALAELSRPVVFAAITTALGFLSFALSPLPAVQVLGFSMAVGVLLCLLWSLTVLPAALVLLGRRGRNRPPRASTLHTALSKFLGRWAELAVGRPVLALLPVALLGVAAGFGAARVHVQDSWIDGLSPDSPLRLATARVDRLFGGTHLLRIRLGVDAVRARGVAAAGSFDDRSVLVDGVLADSPAKLHRERFLVKLASGDPAHASIRPLLFLVTDARIEGGKTRLFLEGQNLPKVPVRTLLPQDAQDFEWEIDGRDRWMQVPMLAELRAFEEFLCERTDRGVGAVLGPWSHLSTMYAMMGTAEERRRIVLESPPGIQRSLDLYLQVRGERRFHELLNSDRDGALVTALVRNANYVSVGDLLGDLREYERERLAPLGIRLAFGGDLAASEAMISAIVKTQFLSILGSFAGVLAIVTLLTRSLSVGMLCTLPCALAVFCVYGAMGWIGMPLGVATSMFAGMAIGVGDDYAIHLWERFRGGMSSGTRAREAAVDSARETGPAILMDALCVGAGFSVLALSHVPTNARLGLLLVLAILGCLAATLHVLPVLFPAFSRRKSPRSP